MYWINYIIKTIIRRIVYLLLKPKVLIALVIALLLIIFLDYNGVFAVYEGNDDYTDKNNTIFSAYNLILNDFINRMSNSSDKSTVNEIKELLTNGQNSCYVYYGNDDGSSMINASTFNTSKLYVAIYPKNANYSSSTSDNYQGIQTQIGSVTNVSSIYEFWDNDIQSLSGKNVQLPVILFNYISSDLLNFLNNSSQQQTNDIVTAIEEQTQATQEQTNTIKEQTEAMTNTTFDDTSVDVDTSASDDVSYDTYSGFFTTIFNNFNSSFSDDDVETISIPIPNTDKTIDITSDIVSSHIGSLASLINVFWYAIFGFYAFKFCNNLIVKIKDGSLLNGLTSTDVITDSMM